MSDSASSRAASRSVSLAEALRFVTVTAVVAIVACGGPDVRPVSELVRSGDLYLEPETMEPYSGLAFVAFEGQPDIVAQRLSIRDGAYDGPFEAFFKNRRLSAREFYADGLKHGPYEWYFESGQLFEEGTYVHGRLDGPYRAYWESGDLYEEGTYVGGAFDGPRRWFKNGRLVELVTYRLGVIEGLYERQDEEGNLVLKGMLFDGEPCGSWLDGDRTVMYPACGARITE